MDNYKPNSHKYKEDQKKPEVKKKKVEKVISGTAKAKKKSEVQKMAGLLFSTEDIDDIRTYIISDVIIPTIKRAIDDTVHMILYPGSSSKRSSPGTKVQYGRFFDRDERTRRKDRTGIRGYSFDNVILNNRGEAEDVLCCMGDLIDTYGLVSVGDLYDLVGMHSNYTDNNYGWTDIHSAKVVLVSDGYLLKLPRPLPLD